MRSMEATTKHCYIICDPAILGGEPIVKGTRTSVRAVVENWRLGLYPEEIVVHLPHLTLAQVLMPLATIATTRKRLTPLLKKIGFLKNLSTYP